MSKYIIAEFKGNYRAPHPEGRREENVTKRFHVKVKMKRECLAAPGLCGLFENYYKEFVRTLYPEMIDFHMFEFVEALNEDGSVINDPKALSYKGLLEYVAERGYPVNVTLYTPTELRNQVNLYEQDKLGQQHLEAKFQAMKGSMLAIANELKSMDDVIQIYNPNEEPAPSPVAKVEPSVEDLLAAPGGKSKTK